MINAFVTLFFVALLFVTGLRRRARARDLAGLTFVQVHEEQLDISELDRPTVWRRAS